MTGIILLSLAGLGAAEPPLSPAAAPVAAAACPPGVHLLEATGDGHATTQIAEHFTERRKMSGLIGFALTGGISGLKVKTVLLGSGAAVQAKQLRPSFRFCYDVSRVAPQAATQGGSAYVGATKTATSPNDYRLVRFEAGAKTRELVISKSNIGGFSGALSDSTIRFTVVEEALGNFKVTPSQDLVAGEYGFVRGIDGDGADVLKKPKQPEQVYDFAVGTVRSADQ